MPLPRVALAYRVPLLVVSPFLAALLPASAQEKPAPPRAYYQDSTWKPRAILPAAVALKGDFWPASPKVEVDYNDPGFDATRLSAVPPPGVHPRVLLSPSDVDVIRARLALGDKAPAEFRALWEREKRNQTAFYALVAKDDALGRTLAAALVAKIKSLEPKLDVIDRQPDHDNLWCAERSIVASGDPNPPTEIWSLIDYDYLAGWMTPEERDRARAVIARLTSNRITNFMIVPDHFMNNNHEGFGMEFIRLLLLIEGEKGFDQRVWELAAHKNRAMLDWYLDKDGMCYESIKGWLNISAFVAVGRRERDLLEHSHLRAKMRFFEAALRWENGTWQIRDEMRASAFHVIWMMHYFHPGDPALELLYSATLSSHPFLTDPNAKWPNPVGISPELLLLFADGAKTDDAGKPLDWTDQNRLDALKFPITWKDDLRGYVITRNSPRKDDLQVGFTCKQDFYYGGHESSENNRLVLWKDGVNWVRDNNMLAVKATFLQNMLTVDGKGLAFPPAPGVWLGVEETPGGLIAAGDGKIGYSFAKVMQVHPLDFPSAQLPYYAPFAEGNFDLTRDQQIAFHPGTVKWNDGYAHTDYGPWSGETRLVESYRSNNPMEQAYRTVYVARGQFPYVLVIDDARKDAQPHLFEWNLTLPENVELLDAKTAAVVFQNPEPGADREDDLLVTAPNTPRDPATGKPIVNKGDPLFLVRSLWRNSPFGFPIPRIEHFNGTPEKPFQNFTHLTIPALSESPEFRVLLYPHRQGDPMPKTTWNADHTELTVEIKDQRDFYRFAKTDGGRTVFSVERNGQSVIATSATPARPALDVRGRRFDVNDLRTTRLENMVPEYRFADPMSAGLVRPSAPAVIRYTLDGTDPTADSPLYTGPIAIKESAELRARTFDPAWPGANKASDVLKARFVRVAAAKGTKAVPADSQPGLLARVYEKKTVLWNDRGFFDAARIMLPDLDRETPVLTTSVPAFTLPAATPSHPQKEQVKGFYRFTGWFNAPSKSTYEFAVNSCGPVLLRVGGQDAIAATGVFHQQQTIRRGEAVLDAGWQPIDLIVCDPLFWNLNTADPMPFGVTVRRDGGEESSIPADQLRFTPGDHKLSDPPEVAWKEASSPPAWLEPGAMLSLVDRTGKNRTPDYLDIDSVTPMRRLKADQFEPNLRPEVVRSYDGWFSAPEDGIYTFDLPARRTQNAALGELRAAYQNQLVIDGDVVVQRGVPGRMPLRQIGLKSGWHRLSLRLGASPGAVTVTYPDGQTLPLTAAALSRPSLVAIHPENQPGGKSRYEIFGPTRVAFSLPAGRQAEIRYRRDGRMPGSQDPVYTAPLELTANTTLTAAAFEKGKALTAPATVEFDRVDVPTADRIASVRFADWNGKTGSTNLDPAAGVWIADTAKLVPGRAGAKALSVNPASSKPDAGGGVDVNVSRGTVPPGFKLSGLQMKQNALTVGLWFRSDTANGKLFGKDGYNAFGKSYKTFSCAIAGGTLRADPGHIAGGKINAGDWQHVVLSADENGMTLYLNGEPVAKGDGSRTLNTDAFDFLSDHPAQVERIAVYNRTLSPDDVRQWFTWERDHPTK